MTIETRELVIQQLEKTYNKYAKLKYNMMGQLYPSMIESKYLLPIRLKICQLKTPGYIQINY